MEDPGAGERGKGRAGVATGPPRAVVRRAASPAEPPPGIPRRFVVAVMIAAVVLGGGGFLADRLIGRNGIPGAAAAAPPAVPTTPTTPPVANPTARLLGLATLSGKPAPPFELTDLAGRRTSLRSLRGRPVLLTFFDPRCTGLCPVLAAELRDVVADLGPRAGQVALITVNASPLQTSAGAVAGAAHAAGLGAVGEWRFLTGPLAVLDRVWTDYGVTVDVDRTSGLISYSNLAYVLGPQGTLRWSVTPFGNERRGGSGLETLPAATERSYAAGLALLLERLIPPAHGAAARSGAAPASAAGR